MNGFGTATYIERKTETLHIRVTPTARRALEGLALQERRDLSDMVRLILERTCGTIIPEH